MAIMVPQEVAIELDMLDAQKYMAIIEWPKGRK